MLAAIPDISADFRDQEIDVFGDTAVETAFFVVKGTLPAGVEMELKLRITSVWVRTTDGWKIAHEHVSEPKRDIVEDRFPGDDAAIRAAMLELDDVVNRQDWDALRSSHLGLPSEAPPLAAARARRRWRSSSEACPGPRAFSTSSVPFSGSVVAGAHNPVRDHALGRCTGTKPGGSRGARWSWMARTLLLATILLNLAIMAGPLDFLSASV
jgi:hypothetical protein